MLKTLLVLLCAFCVAAPVAAAQEDGVFVDPGSPSGKEYALPIDRARAEAAKTNKNGSESKKAPLFGEGVDGKGGSARGAASTRGSSAQVQGTESGGVSPNDPVSGGVTTQQRALRAQAGAADGGLGLGASIGAGVGVLLVGGGVGLWLRRRAMS